MALHAWIEWLWQHKVLGILRSILKLEWGEAPCLLGWKTGHLKVDQWKDRIVRPFVDQVSGRDKCPQVSDELLARSFASIGLMPLHQRDFMPNSQPLIELRHNTRHKGTPWVGG